jgi:cold shock CspA family protein
MESLGRFTGTVKRVGPEFGYITLDDSNTDVWFHRDICEEIDFDGIAVGDRLNFQIKESVDYPGQLSAGRISHEKGSGPKYHPPKTRDARDGHAASVRRKARGRVYQ